MCSQSCFEGGTCQTCVGFDFLVFLGDCCFVDNIYKYICMTFTHKTKRCTFFDKHYPWVKLFEFCCCLSVSIFSIFVFIFCKFLVNNNNSNQQVFLYKTNTHIFLTYILVYYEYFPRLLLISLKVIGPPLSKLSLFLFFALSCCPIQQ